jgi:hypothetical protein
MGEPELNFMMSTITIELPDEVFASMRCDSGQKAKFLPVNFPVIPSSVTTTCGVDLI